MAIVKKYMIEGISKKSKYTSVDPTEAVAQI